MVWLSPNLADLGDLAPKTHDSSGGDDDESWTNAILSSKVPNKIMLRLPRLASAGRSLLYNSTRSLIGSNRFSAYRLASTLVFAEHKDSKLEESTLNAVTAARKLGGPVTALIAGKDADKVAVSLADTEGVDKVVYVKDDAYEHSLPEDTAALIRAIREKIGATHIVGAHSATGKNVLPRLSALLDVQQISDVIGIEGEDVFVRPIYAGNAIATVKSADPIKVLTIRTTSFPAAGKSGDKKAESEESSAADKSALSEWKSESISKSDRPELASAKRVVSGGRAVKSADGFKVIYELADKIGAGVGASRAAVDAGYCDNSMQVGQTGKIVAPELYVAIGISGAIQHLAGMKDSKVIVAINKDPDAPIFQIADYGLVGDLFTIVPELTKKL
ncbi:Electron transfer flavoprotein alpha-subunit [Mycoemilia scoparia]|uniref:Probable electron transfer flavoprotein subunit alpha n=1 Tax=Mycoemilia scoparia TaxID=417184 RepID=A0A9W8A3K2_9FUNG|nr:Electron transfer flavoprotein alpha-subunit [Mycoemilia scoparia]